jgi:hypothetical protein
MSKDAFWLWIAVLMLYAGAYIAFDRQTDKIADAIQAGREVDTVYVGGDSLVYRLEIVAPDMDSVFAVACLALFDELGDSLRLRLVPKWERSE